MRGGPLDGESRVIANNIGPLYRVPSDTIVHLYERGEHWRRTDGVREAIYEWKGEA
jgi:hypothetical protein